MIGFSKKYSLIKDIGSILYLILVLIVGGIVFLYHLLKSYCTNWNMDYIDRLLFVCERMRA